MATDFAERTQADLFLQYPNKYIYVATVSLKKYLFLFTSSATLNIALYYVSSMSNVI